VRPHAAARHRVAHHHVVDARVRNEIEGVEKTVGVRAEVIRILDQHCPAAAWKLLEARRGNRSMLDLPLRAASAHESRHGIARTREREYLARRQWIAKGRERTTNEQRLALPVAAHERCGIDAGGVLA
jgi:hypothetical protein